MASHKLQLKIVLAKYRLRKKRKRKSDFLYYYPNLH